jgi:hypothetical protein
MWFLHLQIKYTFIETIYQIVLILILLFFFFV